MIPFRRLFARRPRPLLRSDRARRGAFRAPGLEQLETRTVFAVHLAPLLGVDMNSGKDQLIPLQGSDDQANPVSYSVNTNNASVTASVITGGRSVRFSVTGTDSTNAPFSGELEFRLFEQDAPLATGRLISLIQNGFYAGNPKITFHRVISGFMAQGGDPTATGSGGSGMPDFSDEFNTAYTFTSRGVLAMANSGDDTNDSQFFITDPAVPLAGMPQHLNFNHTIFGLLTKGQDVMARIMGVTTTGNGGSPANKPLNNVTIQSATIFTDAAAGVLRLHTAAGFTGSFNVTATASNGQGSTQQQTQTITVSADTINDRPFLAPLGAVSTFENQAVTFDTPAIDLENDPISFYVTDGDDISLAVKHGTIGGNIVPASGNTPSYAHITFTPEAGFSGAVKIMILARDQTIRDGNSSLNALSNFDSQIFTINVAPINHAPDFTASNPPASSEDAGQQTVPNWAAFNPGPAATDGSQTATYTTTVTSNAALFSVPPAVSPSGTLTYTAAPHTFGTATFTVKVKDSGGTANGGIDTSATNSFTITVNYAYHAPVTAGDVVLMRPDTNVDIGVLSNDWFDPNATPVLGSVALASPPAHGSVVIDSQTGQINYAPEAGFSGADTFQYTVLDSQSGLSNPGTVRIVVAEHPWQNPTSANDVSGSGGITNLDAFTISSEIKAHGAHALAVPFVGSSGAPPYYDVDGNDVVNNLDYFRVVAAIRNPPSGEGLVDPPTANGGVLLDAVPPGLTPPLSADSTAFASGPSLVSALGSSAPSLATSLSAASSAANVPAVVAASSSAAIALPAAPTTGAAGNVAPSAAAVDLVLAELALADPLVDPLSTN